MHNTTSSLDQCLFRHCLYVYFMPSISPSLPLPLPLPYPPELRHASIFASVRDKLEDTCYQPVKTGRGNCTVGLGNLI